MRTYTLYLTDPVRTTVTAEMMANLVGALLEENGYTSYEVSALPPKERV